MLVESKTFAKKVKKKIILEIHVVSNSAEIPLLIEKLFAKLLRKLFENGSHTTLNNVVKHFP